MHVGLSVMFQNLDGNFTDEQVYKHQVSIADLAEPLGFDSVWASEHHFNGYTMFPNVTQFLTYMAGRTKRVTLRTKVTVLPLPYPISVADTHLVLSHVSGGSNILRTGKG